MENESPIEFPFTTEVQPEGSSNTEAVLHINFPEGTFPHEPEPWVSGELEDLTNLITVENTLGQPQFFDPVNRIDVWHHVDKKAREWNSAAYLAHDYAIAKSAESLELAHAKILALKTAIEKRFPGYSQSSSIADIDANIRKAIYSTGIDDSRGRLTTGYVQDYNAMDQPFDLADSFLRIPAEYEHVFKKPGLCLGLNRKRISPFYKSRIREAVCLSAVESLGMNLEEAFTIYDNVHGSFRDSEKTPFCL